MTDHDHDSDGDQSDYFESEGDGEPDDFMEEPDQADGQPVRIPGLDAYLRSTMEPIFRQLQQFAAGVMPRIGPLRLTLPEIRVTPDLGRSLIDTDRILEPWREAVAAMVDWKKLARSVIDPALPDRLRDLVARRMPPNWAAVDDWREAAKFIDETGWAIVWLPRGETVATLLAVPPDARETTLLEHTTSIIDDAITCSREVQHERLAFVADCITEIGSSIRDGHHRAAQALAGSVLTELIQGILGHTELAGARVEYAEPWQEKSIRILRFALITSAIPLALERFYRQKGDPIPVSFNRHAVAHAASPVQFTPVNAVVGLILVTALTRELQELFDEGLLAEDD